MSVKIFAFLSFMLLRVDREVSIEELVLDSIYNLDYWILRFRVMLVDDRLCLNRDEYDFLKILRNIFL